MKYYWGNEINQPISSAEYRGKTSDRKRDKTKAIDEGRLKTASHPLRYHCFRQINHRNAFALVDAHLNIKGEGEWLWRTEEGDVRSHFSFVIIERIHAIGQQATLGATCGTRTSRMRFLAICSADVSNTSSMNNNGSTSWNRARSKRTFMSNNVWRESERVTNCDETVRKVESGQRLFTTEK